VLNYFGQGALLIVRPEAVTNPSTCCLPAGPCTRWLRSPPAATVIASQAVISGAYSITRQAVQLGFLPRINVVHTSAREIGQSLHAGGQLDAVRGGDAAVIGFGSSSRLAGAYGVAVTATMMVDTLLTFFVIRYAWRYPLWLCLLATGFFLVIDLAFFCATLLKVADGGWFPLAIGTCVFAMMTTWRRGREHLFGRLRASSVPLEDFLKSLFLDPPMRVPGTAVFLTATPDATPHALLHNLSHNKVLHERVVFLTVEVREEPWVSTKERVVCQKLGNGCWRVLVNYGFLDRPRRHAGAQALRRRGARHRDDGDLVLPLARADRRPPKAAPAWRAGATACSPRWRATPATSPTSSTSPPTG
jgi:KUP system potassium uptake protein